MSGYFRFRRRLRVAPGLWLNLNKRSASVSIGGRGAHLTLGKHGRRATIGLPGSGLSYTDYRRYARQPPPERLPAYVGGVIVLLFWGAVAAIVLASLGMVR